MNLAVYRSAGAFLRETQNVLEEREAENNLMLGLCLKMVQSSEEIERVPYFATVMQNDDLLVAAIMTPPHQLIIYSDTNVRVEAFKLLAADLLAKGSSVPGVIGRSVVANEFAKVWEEAADRSATHALRHRIYKLSDVNQAQTPSGSFSPATRDDLTLLVQWTLAFHHEALPNDPLSDVQGATKNRIDHKHIFIWEDAGPVSMAARSRPTSAWPK